MGVVVKKRRCCKNLAVIKKGGGEGVSELEGTGVGVVVKYPLPDEPSRT